MSCVCTVTFRGNCQSCCVTGSTPRYAVGLVAAPQPVSTRPLGGVPRVIDFVTTGPRKTSPTLLMDDCSTSNGTLWPGIKPWRA